MPTPPSIRPEDCVFEYLKNGSEIELNFDGSTTPVDYIYTIPAGKRLILERILFYIDDATAFTPVTFGGLSALTNGVDVTLAGVTLVNWKTNEDVVNTCHDFIGYSNLGKTTSSGHGRWTMARSFGSPMRLNAGETVVFTVNDDLTGLEHFSVKLHGYLVDQ